MSEAIQPGLTMEEYQKHWAVSASDIKLFLNKSPYHFRHRKELPGKESASLSFGTAMHYAILEPGDYDKHKAIEPALRRNTNAYKDWAKAQSPEAIIVSEEFDQTVKEIKTRLKQTGLAPIFDNGLPECSIFGTNNGLDLKCRPDWLDVSTKRIVDLKTTRDLKWFKSDAKKFGYPLSVPHYKHIIAQATDTYASDWNYVFVVVESEPPFDCNWYILTPALEAEALRQWEGAIESIGLCMQSGTWPGFTKNEPELIT